ncbi:MAG: hypothetical protein HY895_03525 [Deltaproteobacteria bacterium]|nr:hypothetical protein [Deltaproteobacteria bacterium]
MRDGKCNIDFASTVTVSEILPTVPQGNSSETCCGPPPAPASSPNERPGYRLLPFVAGFIHTPAGPVPRVATALAPADLIGVAAVRCGIGRNRRAIAPGLYAVGPACADSPVLVTANYKLTFDTLRRELSGVGAWVLVLDTRGVNVWCAAGKKLFSHDELALRVQRTGLERVVRHRRLILPQLAASGVSARQVKKKCGFEVVWGPVRASDIQTFLRNGMKAEAAMRRVTFTFGERLVLVPVELSFLPKPTAVILAALFLMSGIGGGIFSFDAAWARGLAAAAAYAAGVLAGAVATPVLLPWIPGRAFAVKGALTGTAVGGLLILLLRTGLHAAELPALLVLTAAVSSYLAMNFTGSTPFTSPSGVEKEMRRAIPLQAAAFLAFALAWVGSAFVG